jgi:hypothetical protein
MRVRGTVVAVALGCAVATLGITADGALAKKGGKETKTDVRARLHACCSDPLLDAHGHVKHRTRSLGDQLTRDRVQAKAEFGLGELGLDGTTAPAADVRAVFSRDGAPYAECAMVFDGLQPEDDDDPDLEALYKVDVEWRADRGLRERKGTCDVDLATDGVQTGVPAVQAGDTVSVFATVGAGAELEVLQGTAFQKK